MDLTAQAAEALRWSVNPGEWHGGLRKDTVLFGVQFTRRKGGVRWTDEGSLCHLSPLSTPGLSVVEPLVLLLTDVYPVLADTQVLHDPAPTVLLTLSRSLSPLPHPSSLEGFPAVPRRGQFCSQRPVGLSLPSAWNALP